MEGLLNFGRMEAGTAQYRFETIDPAELVAAVSREFEQDAEASLRRAVSLAVRQGWDHIAVGPDMRLESLGEAVFVAAFMVIFNSSQRPWLASDPRRRNAIGIGAFNLVRREAYRRSGGHGAIRYELLDDMALGKILKEGGARQVFAKHDGLAAVRWHPGVGGLIRGVEKNAFPAARYNILLGATAPWLMLWIGWAPVLGLTLPGASSIPAADSGHPRMCAAAGRRIVDMVWEELTPERILTPGAFDNAIKVHMAMGGSTNAIIHVIAMARRAGVALDMQRFDRLSREVPVLANVRPSGKYLMEDFFYAGGLRALMMELKDRLDLSCVTVTGKTVGENIAGAEVYLRDVIHSLAEPVYAEGATAVLTGNLAPRGCVMKPAAADQRFLKHRGPALAFEDYNHMAREIERDDLAATPDHVIVLKNAGPKGGPGMPEWGMLPIPKKLVQAGVRDMVRISDGRMSGTSYGACILHVSPESFVGGPLAFVKTGDTIELDVSARRIHLDVAEEELNRRRAAWKQPAPRYARGYGAMFSAHIGQADEGCDFDFLAGKGQIPEPEIH